MIVYGSSFSPFVRKVLAFAAEKAIAVETIPVSLQSAHPAFLEASPFRKMPALRDGDFTLPDSSAIVAYMEAMKPEPNLIPSSPRARGRVVWLEEFADSILAGVGAKIFFNRVVAPRFLKRPGDEAVAAHAAEHELPPVLDYLEAQLPESGWLVEDRLTLADIAAASPFANLAHAGVPLDDGRHPRTAAFAARMLARPAFASWVAAETAQLAAAG